MLKESRLQSEIIIKLRPKRSQIKGFFTRVSVTDTDQTRSLSLSLPQPTLPFQEEWEGVLDMRKKHQSVWKQSIINVSEKIGV